VPKSVGVRGNYRHFQSSQHVPTVAFMICGDLRFRWNLCGVIHKPLKLAEAQSSRQKKKKNRKNVMGQLYSGF